MLTSLCIEHFTIVKRLELDFSQGMTAFTGETGAGKSIMIDALMLALGGRGDASLIRPGEAKCEITARFNFDKNSELALWLAEHDLFCEEDELYLRRIIYKEGRSKSYINAQPFPLQKLKELGEKLVHLHGQHQHYSLMQHGTHREQLDLYANHQDLVLEVQQLYKRMASLRQELDKLLEQEQQSDKIKLLQFQIEELDALQLQEDEVERLHKEHQMLHHAKDYLTYSQQISNLLNAEEPLNICAALNQIIHLIKNLPQGQAAVKNTEELIHSALIQCEEALDEMRFFAEDIQIAPERLQEVELRMSTIHHLARKYHIDSKELLKHQQKLTQELSLLHNIKTQLSSLELELEKQRKNYEAAALKLRESRIIHAQKLAEEITGYMQQLGMPKGWLEIELTALDKPQAHGLDKVEYKVCTNPGMKLDSLHKIASGGELSRIGLAIQMITAQRGRTPTLLFDEVDVGIGGSTAALVGQLLHHLGARLQVFCVTHQPQVAAYAHHHFRVDKKSDQNQTLTQIQLLFESEKVDELARMLGGLIITDQTRSHAQELIQQSRNSKKIDELA